MKNVIKTLAITIVAILLISISFLQNTYALSLRPVESKEHEPNRFIDNHVFGIHTGPTSQAKMQEKFSCYNVCFYETEDEQIREGIILFNSDYVEEFMTQKEDGNLRGLTYDETLFIINDSIQLYNKYDMLILRDAGKYGILTDAIDSDDVRITSYHGGFSEFQGNERNIKSIIQFRLFMLNSGMQKAAIESVGFSGRYGFGQTLYLEDEIDNITKVDQDYTYYSDCFVMIIDENNELNTKELYLETLRSEFETALGVYDTVDTSYRDFDLEYPLVLLNVNCPFMPDIVICNGSTYIEYNIEDLIGKSDS